MAVPVILTFAAERSAAHELGESVAALPASWLSAALTEYLRMDSTAAGGHDGLATGTTPGKRKLTGV